MASSAAALEAGPTFGGTTRRRTDAQVRARSSSAGGNSPDPADSYDGLVPSEPLSDQPLAGVRVIECATVLAGPYATMVLADLGADVIKVEPPDGDATRGWGPPWVGDGPNRTAAYYLSINRNKRSIVLDLRTRDGAEVLRRLLAGADAFVENFRFGALERLGFGDDELQRLRPGLVHLAISGYGVTGPEASKPGYDFVAQAVGGLMSITGAADAAGGEPTKVGVAVSDVVTGLFGAIGVLAALAGRRGLAARSGAAASSDAAEAASGAPAASGAAPAGSGAAPAEADRRPTPATRVDVSLLESTLAMLINQAQNAFVSGVSPGRRGNAHPNIVPYELFDTADRPIVVAVGSERQWPRFCEAIGLAGLTTDERFATNADRVANRDALRALIAAKLRGGTAASWLGGASMLRMCRPGLLTTFSARSNRPSRGHAEWTSRSTTRSSARSARSARR